MMMLVSKKKRDRKKERGKEGKKERGTDGAKLNEERRVNLPLPPSFTQIIVNVFAPR